MVAVDAIRPLGRIVDGVEQRLVVRGPGQGAGLIHLEGQQRAVLEVLQVQRVVAEAGHVGRVGEVAPVVGDHERAQREELQPLREDVLVEDDLLRTVGSLPAAEDRILLSLLGPRVVPVRAVPGGNREVGLLDAREHLLVERLLQGLRRLHHRVGVGVLRLQVGGDVRVGLLPQPEIVVQPLLAVQLRADLRLPRDGDGGQSGDRLGFGDGVGFHGRIGKTGRSDRRFQRSRGVRRLSNQTGQTFQWMPRRSRAHKTAYQTTTLVTA